MTNIRPTTTQFQQAAEKGPTIEDTKMIDIVVGVHRREHAVE